MKLLFLIFSLLPALTLRAETTLVEGNVIEFRLERELTRELDVLPAEQNRYFIAFDYETAYLVPVDERLPKELDGCALSLELNKEQIANNNPLFVTKSGVSYPKTYHATLRKVIGCPDPNIIKQITILDKSRKKLRW